MQFIRAKAVMASFTFNQRVFKIFHMPRSFPNLWLKIMPPSSPAISSRSCTKYFHQAFLILFLSSTPNGRNHRCWPGAVNSDPGNTKPLRLHKKLFFPSCFVQPYILNDKISVLTGSAKFVKFSCEDCLRPVLRAEFRSRKFYKFSRTNESYATSNVQLSLYICFICLLTYQTSPAIIAIPITKSNLWKYGLKISQ